MTTEDLPLRECMWTRTEIAVADFVCREVRRSLGELYKRDIGFVPVGEV